MLADLNDAAVNMVLQIEYLFEFLVSVLLGLCSEVEKLDQRVLLFLPFRGIPFCLSWYLDFYEECTSVINKIECLFCMFIAHGYVFFRKVSFQPLCLSIRLCFVIDV